MVDGGTCIKCGVNVWKDKWVRVTEDQLVEELESMGWHVTQNQETGEEEMICPGCYEKPLTAMIELTYGEMVSVGAVMAMVGVRGAEVALMLDGDAISAYTRFANKLGAAMKEVDPDVNG